MTESKRDKRGLGRGLSALMADVGSVEETTTSASASKAGEKLIPIDQIEPNENQPRKFFDEDALEELASSMREKGIIQPLIVVQHPDNEDKYQIVAGERRWRAAQRANLHELPVLVRSYTENEILEIAIIENIQRAELNAIEEAAGYRQLMDRFGHTQEKIAEALGKSRSHVANFLRLLTLPDDVRAHVENGRLSAGHARALITAENPAFLADAVIKKGLSVRETEKLAKTSGVPKQASVKGTAQRDADTVALENDLSAALGLKVVIDHLSGSEAGKLTIKYKDLDELDRICGILSTAR